MTSEQEQTISLRLMKWRPDNIDNTFIHLAISSIRTGTVEFRWTEQQFRNLIGELEHTGSVEITQPLREMHFDLEGLDGDNL